MADVTTRCKGCIYAHVNEPMSAVAYPCNECRRNPIVEIVDHYECRTISKEADRGDTD